MGFYEQGRGDCAFINGEIAGGGQAVAFVGVCWGLSGGRLGRTTTALGEALNEYS